LFPLTVQNNGVQLYDYDYKNNKTFVPGEGIPLPTKEILIMKTMFYSILAEPQKKGHKLTDMNLFHLNSLILKENPYVELANHFIQIRPKLCNHMV